jgi:ribosomal protein S18 acetylase RimI-like enzyme
MYQIQILSQKSEMLNQFDVVKQLYTDFAFEKYGTLLDEMLLNNYKQIIIVENNETIALTGFWIGTKLWCGKYVEIDNFIVDEKYRGKKIGDILVKEILKIADEEKATQICLDAYTTNFSAAKFYMNHGFVPKGFHFVKFLNQ